MATSATTDASFEQDVLKSETPVLVDFWATWCGPCRAIAPVLEELSTELAGKLNIVKLNIDENPQTTARFGVTSIPTMYVFKGGEVVKTIVGAHPKPRIVKELNGVI